MLELIAEFSRNPCGGGCGCFDGYEKLPRTLLNLYCGTGAFAGFFLSRGYVVYAIDPSKAMVEFASKVYRKQIDAGVASFVVGDPLRPRLDQCVSYALCCFEAIGQAESVDSIETCCRCVCESLSPGGLFVFNYITRKGLRRLNAFSIQDEDDLLVLTRGMYEDGMVHAYVKTTGFKQRQDGSYDRFTNTAVHLPVSWAELLDVVSRAGFAKAYCACSGDLRTAVGNPENLARAFVVCEKG